MTVPQRAVEDPPFTKLAYPANGIVVVLAVQAFDLEVPLIGHIYTHQYAELLSRIGSLKLIKLVLDKKSLAAKCST